MVITLIFCYKKDCTNALFYALLPSGTEDITTLGDPPWLGTPGELYRKLAEVLSADFQVFVPDLPGFGKTPEPKQTFTVSSYANTVKKWLKEEGIDEAFFVGHSFGGRVTIKLAHLHPKLVKALVLTGTPGVEKFNPKRTTKRIVYWVAAKLGKLLSFIPAVRRVRNRFYAKRDYGKLEGVMKKTFLKVIRERLRKDVKKIKQPTLLIWGRRDQMAPARDAEKMLSLIPHSYLKIFTKVGHKLPYQLPHEFAREVLHFFSRFA